VLTDAAGASKERQTLHFCKESTDTSLPRRGPWSNRRGYIYKEGPKVTPRKNVFSFLRDWVLFPRACGISPRFSEFHRLCGQSRTIQGPEARTAQNARSPRCFSDCCDNGETSGNGSGSFLDFHRGMTLSRSAKNPPAQSVARPKTGTCPAPGRSAAPYAAHGQSSLRAAPLILGGVPHIVSATRAPPLAASVAHGQRLVQSIICSVPDSSPQRRGAKGSLPNLALGLPPRQILYSGRQATEPTHAEMLVPVGAPQTRRYSAVPM
jgi:hypothetical protein